MIPERFIKTGDVGVTLKGETVIGKIISLFSKPHTFNLAWENDELYVYEMVSTYTFKGKKTGVLCRLYEDSYRKKGNWALMKRVGSLNKEEKSRCVEFLKASRLINSGYDINSLLKHLTLSIGLGYKFEKIIDTKWICSQYSAMKANYERAFTFPREEAVSPQTIYESKFYYKETEC